MKKPPSITISLRVKFTTASPEKSEGVNMEGARREGKRKKEGERKDMVEIGEP